MERYKMFAKNLLIGTIDIIVGIFYAIGGALLVMLLALMLYVILCFLIGV